MKLSLGTVQFGLDYGINKKKKPSLNDSVVMLDYATQNGIDAIDTAAAYGNAEEVVGAFLGKKTIQRDKLFISTKLLPNCLDEVDPDKYSEVVETRLKSSLKTLGTDYVNAYLFHSARYAYNDAMLDAMLTVQKRGLAKKVGVSVYEPEEVFACLKSGKVAFIQAPYSVFDHRMKGSGAFKAIAASGVEIDTRSAFLQGLAVMNEDRVPEFLAKAKPMVSKINKICKEAGISKAQLALSYVKEENTISHLVFGVHSIEQLKEDIRLFDNDISDDVFEYINKEFSDVDADIVIPSLWKKD